MDDHANRIAAYLIQQGIGHGNVVSIMIPRHEIMIIASLAVLKTGAAYQPLDSTYPGDRLEFMISDSAASLLITTHALRDKVAGYQGNTLLLDLTDGIRTEDVMLPSEEDAREIVADHRRRDGEILPEDLFTLLYTSGTTGKPKGVMLRHSNLLCTLNWMIRYQELTCDSAVGAYASYGFDANLQDMYSPLMVGGTCVIVPENMRLELDAMNEYMQEHHVTHMFMTTQVGRQFVENERNPYLKYLMVGGEVLAPVEPPEGIRFVNGYGPTETTLCCAAFEVDQKRENNPIGKAVDNVKLYITDLDGHRLPSGAAGELLISGPHVTGGYLNRPDKTSEVFIDNPFVKAEEDSYRRAYRSGDVIRFRCDGNLEFIGRRDGQVKIRGFRIELPEVEAVIRECDGVKDVAVAAFDHPGGGKYICAYVVSIPTEDGKPMLLDTDLIRAHILSMKPAYMVPEVFMFIDSIPLNQNGKVNRRALPEPVRVQAEIVEPKTETQKKIFDCVAEAIGHREFGITTDIMTAGLTSITSIALNVRLSKAFQMPFKISDIRENPTVEQLERFILNADKISLHEKQEVYPLCMTQEGVFVDCVANAGTTIYNIPSLFKLSDQVDIAKAKKALECVVQAHPYLKVRLFMNEQGEFCQRRMDDENYEVPVLNEMDQSTLVRPFDILHDRLFRMELYQTYNGNYLFMDFHHLVADGTSITILLQDLERAYLGETLTEETYSTYDLALDMQAQKNSSAYEKAAAYYETLFGTVRGSTDLPFDKEDSTPSVSYVRSVLKGVRTDVVQAYCEKMGITENAFFVASFGLLLSRYHFDDHAVFTTIYHGRNDARLSETVGMLVKTFPVVVRRQEDAKTFFTDVKLELMGLMEADAYPYSEAAKKYELSTNTLFVYQGDGFAFDHICGEPADDIELELNAAKEPVSIQVMKGESEFICEIEYRGDLYVSDTMKSLIDNYSVLIEALLDGTSPEDVRLGFDNDEFMTDSPLFGDRTIVDLLRDNAARYPDRLAVKDQYGEWNYEQLNRISEYVAHKLIQKGFEPEHFAGILCSRRKEFVAAVLGVMKAGGAYVPLDPDYPEDRIAYMLADSKSGHLLVEKELLPIVHDYKGETIFLKELVEEGLEKVDVSRATEQVKIVPEQLAYMIYTSGSTGKPKGVELTHKNLNNLMFALSVQQETTKDDEYGLFSSFCFDASVHDLFIPFAHGASLYIIPEESRRDVMKVCAEYEREPITITTMPTQMGELTAQMLSEKCKLRIMTLGGEKFKRHYDTKFAMYNGYGPTENTVSSTSFLVDRDYENIPIGKPHLNTRAYVVDEQLRRVPVGAPGELCVAGRQIAKGYHNLPEKTAKVFVPNPFMIHPDERVLYHTGDLVRQKGDGNYEYIGRIDSQVKIRGYRVELGEIEGAIPKQAGVSEAAVVATETNGIMNIVAYYTGKEYSDQEWQTFLSPLLPEYMLPSFYVYLDKMPVTPGGKLDKKHLPAPVASGNEYTAPETEIQKALCEIFASALGTERVGIHDDFFGLGGSSLAASKVTVMCLARKIDLVFADIFKHHTVAELALVVEGKESAKAADEFASYDYSGIQSVIAANDLRNLDLLEKEDIGDIVLTGATGFLGIHVLKTFLERYTGKVYCLVRKGHFESAEKRLMVLLMYYFDSTFDSYFGDRIQCLDGDITEPDSLEQLKDIEFKTLINCAACVKHFASDGLLEQINVTGVRNLIRICKTAGRRMVQISTVSVAGDLTPEMLGQEPKLFENRLYLGQQITNEYIRSKFLAEREVLQAVGEGLDAKIIRVGNLMSRQADGEFQINFITNGFLRSLRGYSEVGAFPVTAMGEVVEFSPIDCTAEAVLTLAGTGQKFTVFHATNIHRIYMGDVIRAMNLCGHKISIMAEEAFSRTLDTYVQEHADSEKVAGLIAYASHDNAEIRPIDYDNSFTREVLYRLGYDWPITDNQYLIKAIEALEGLNFFD